MDLELADIRLAFGEVLREVRREAGLSQEELALSAGYERNYIGMMERGERQPTLETLLYLGHALKLDAEVLVTRTRQRLSRKR